MEYSLMPQLIELIAARFGLRIRESEQNALWRIVLLRVKALNLRSPAAYFQILSTPYPSTASAHEWQELANQLTVTESYFFRDEGQFSLLRDHILPEIIHRKLHQSQINQLPPRLRIWSAGCASGEEAYSLAMLIDELIPDLSQWEILILGTDINARILERANRGIFTDWSFRSVKPCIQQKYFRPHREGWEIRPQIRSLVKFQADNLLQTSDPLSEIHAFDLILCRNVFIYFGQTAIAQALKKFHKALNPNGYLLTGHTELHQQKVSEFQLLSFPKSVIYQRVEVAQSQPVAMPLPTAYEMSKVNSAPNFNPSSYRSAYFASSRPTTYPTETRTGSNPAQSQNVEIAKLVEEEHYLAAIAHCNYAIEKKTANFKTYHLLAKSYANLGDHNHAKEACETAIKLNSLATEAYYLLSQVSEEQGDLETAVDWLKRVIYLEPKLISAYLELGSLYRKMGNSNKAQCVWNSALKLLNQVAENSVIDEQQKLTAGEAKVFVERNLKQ